MAEASVSIFINAIDNFSRVFAKATISMQSFKQSAIVFAAVGGILAAGIGISVKNTIDLETAMVGVRKTTGLTAVEIEGLRKEIIEMSREIPLSVTELANIAEVAGQLGIVGTKNIKSFTEVAAKMAIATELTAEDSALALAKISTAMDLPIADAEKLGSAINELSNISAASSSEIVSALVRVAGSANQLGISTDIVSGMTAALIASGEPAERAGTKLRSAFDMMITKIDEASKFMGVDFKEALEKDANGAILSLIKKLSEIESPVERQQKAMDLFGKIGASAISKLTGNLPEMNRLIEASAGQFENATSLQEEFDIAVESTKNQIILLKNQFTEASLEIGDVFIPILRDTLIPILQTFANFLTNLSDGQKEFIAIMALVTVGVLAAAFAFAFLTVASLVWIGGLLLVAAAITGLILIFKNWDNIQLKTAEIIGRVINFIIDKWEILRDSMKVIFAGIKNVVVSAWNFIVTVQETRINALIRGLNTLISGINKIPGIDIPQLSEVDFSNFKGELTDIAALENKLAIQRAISSTERAGALNNELLQLKEQLGLNEKITEEVDKVTKPVEEQAKAVTQPVTEATKLTGVAGQLQAQLAAGDAQDAETRNLLRQLSNQTNIQAGTSQILTDLFSQTGLGGIGAEDTRELLKDIRPEIAERERMTINIENVFGTDPSAISEALHDEFSTKTST